MTRQAAILEDGVLIRSLFDTMREGVALCRMLPGDGELPDFVYLKVNAAFDELLGLGDVVGKKATDAAPGSREANPELYRIYDRVATTGCPERFETFLERRNAWFAVSASCPAPGHFIAIFMDISDRKRNEAELRLHSTALNAAANAIAITDRQGTLVWLNPAFTALTGYAAKEAIGRNPRDLLRSGVHDAAFYQDFWNTILAGKVWRGEMVNRRKDGRTYPEAQTVTPVRDASGAITHFIAIKRDLTEEKQLRSQQLQAQKMTAVAEALSGFGDIHAALGDVLSHCVDSAGLSRGAVMLRETDTTWRCAAQIGFDTNLLHDLGGMFGDGAGLGAVLKADAPFPVAPNSATVPGADQVLARLGASTAIVAPIGTGPGMRGALLLTSATRQLSGEDWTLFANAIGAQLNLALSLSDAFERLQASELRFHSLFDGVPVGLFQSTPDGVLLAENPAMVAMLGYPNREALLAVNAKDLYVDPGDRRRYIESLERAAVVERFPTRLRRLDGSEVPVELTSGAVRGPDGALQRIDGAIVDVTAFRRTEAALRAAEHRLQQVVDAMPATIYALRFDATTLVPSWVSENITRTMGYSVAEALEPHWWLERVHPDDRVRVLGGQSALVAHGSLAREYRFRSKDGTWRWVLDNQRLLRDAQGTPTEVVGAWIDVSELKSLEAKLTHSQKIEAVGLLAGGIAHDFNNLLAAITMFTELVSKDLPVSDPRGADLASVLDAARRATSLTRQLLAFSRQQVLRPAVLDLNDVIRDVGKLLTRLIGEDIEFATEFDPDPQPVHADAGQLEQVLLNLALNARDAMPAGGRFLVRTERQHLDAAAAATVELAAGWYAVIVAADTGSGIAPGVLGQIFEPFFSTKGSKGTGLGLATVYGIIKQSGGHIGVTSEPGRGTVFTIHLPVWPGPAATKHDAAPATMRGGTETILVAEDEPSVRHAFAAVLGRLGYTLIVGRSGEDLLNKVAGHRGPIHLILSDVVMPGIDGRELIQLLQQTYPGAKGLLTSGYAGDPISRRGVLDSGLPFLEKPFSADQLARKVREVLDAPNA